MDGGSTLCTPEVALGTGRRRPHSKNTSQASPRSASTSPIPHSGVRGSVRYIPASILAQRDHRIHRRGQPAHDYPGYATLDFGDKSEAWAWNTPACFFLKAGAVRSIVAGGYRSLALLNDWTVVGWGDPVGYPLPSIPGHPRFDPPVPLDIAIDKASGSQVPVSVGLLDAEGTGSGDFKFATGSAYSTRETKGTLILHVDDLTRDFPPGSRYVLPTGPRTLRLLARSGDIAVETSFTIDVRPPLQFEVFP